MQNAELMTENSESQDGDTTGQSYCSKNCSEEETKYVHSTTTLSLSSASASATGYYDAEKCRAHIANQSRVSKIDRFAVQVNRAVEIETDVHRRLSNILNMFLKRSAKVAHDFSLKCKLGSQRHRQDRILNQSKRSSKKQQHQQQSQHTSSITPSVNISNDLLYGRGAQLVHELLNQPMLFLPPRHPKKKSKHETPTNEQEDSHQPKGSELFEPSLFVDKLEDSIRDNIKKSKAIMNKLVTLQQLFKNMAAEHRDKVDFVYAAEEERQATTVIRRSAYNLSVAAIKATSTPMST